MLKASSTLSNFSPVHSSRVAFLITTSRHHQPVIGGFDTFRDSPCGGFRRVTLEAEDVVLEPGVTPVVAVGEAFALEELIRGSGGLMVTLVRRTVVSEVEGWCVGLWSGFDVVEIVRGLSAPFDLLLTFEAGGGVVFNAFSRAPSRYLRTAS